MSGRGPKPWLFLTSHAHVLLAVAEAPNARVRDVADAVDLTERQVQRILADLTGAGYLRVTKNGARNSYEVDPELPLRHPKLGGIPLERLLSLFHRSEEEPMSRFLGQWGIWDV